MSMLLHVLLTLMQTYKNKIYYNADSIVHSILLCGELSKLKISKVSLKTAKQSSTNHAIIWVTI